MFCLRFFCNCQAPSSGSGLKDVKEEVPGAEASEEEEVPDAEQVLKEERERNKKKAEQILERCAKVRRSGALLFWINGCLGFT